MARLIAIDLGSHAVKVSVYQGTAAREDLEAEVRLPVPQDGSEAPSLADRLAVLDLLLRQNPEWTTGSHLTAVAFPADHVSVHRLSLPFTEAAQIEQTLPFAVEAEVPFDLDDMVLGWRPVGDDGVVLTTLARTDTLERMIGGLAERGLDPRRIYTDGDLLALFAQETEEHVAVIDVGHSHTVVTIARDGQALNYRSIGVGGRAFTRAIQVALDCGWRDAQLLKHGGEDDDPVVPVALVEDDGPALDDDVLGGEFALDGDEHAVDAVVLADEEDTNRQETFDAPTSGDDPPTEATDPIVGELPPQAQQALHGALGLLLAEVRTTLVQAEDDLGIDLSRVVLTGGGSRVDGLRDFLAQDLGLPVDHALDDEGRPVHGEFALSHALAHHVTGEAETGVTDLRVGDLAYTGGFDLSRAIVQYGGMFLGIFLFTVMGWTVWQFTSLSSQMAEVEDRTLAVVTGAAPEVPADMEATTAVSLLRDLVIDAQTEVEFLGDGSEAPPTVDLLHALTEGFPPHPDVTVNVDELEITPKAIQLTGVTQGFAQVDKIGESLVATGRFAQVEAVPGNKNKAGNLGFTVNISREASDEVSDTDIPFDEEG